MLEILKSVTVGFVLGGVFTLLKLDVPAPATVAGFAGIVGIYIGYILAKQFI